MTIDHSKFFSWRNKLLRKNIFHNRGWRYGEGAVYTSTKFSKEKTTSIFNSKISFELLTIMQAPVVGRRWAKRQRRGSILTQITLRPRHLKSASGKNVM